MAFTKVLLAIARVFPSKSDKNSKKITKTRKFRNLVSLFAGRRSKRRSTSSETTLVGSSDSSPARNLTVNTVEVNESIETIGTNIPLPVSIPNSPAQHPQYDGVDESEDAASIIQDEDSSSDELELDDLSSDILMPTLSSLMAPEIAVSMAAIPMAIPQRAQPLPGLPDPAPVIIRANTKNQGSEAVGAVLVADNEWNDKSADEGVFSLELENTVDSVDQQTEDAKGLEEELEDILSTEVILHRQVPRPALPPGFSFPWGLNNPVPTQLGDFTSTDYFLPNPNHDPVGFNQLNGVQQRWVMLEAFHNAPIFYICRDNLAENLHQQQPYHFMYDFDNFCGYLGCKVESCEHPRPNGNYWLFPGLHNVVPELQHIRQECMRRARERAEHEAAERYAAAKFAAEQHAFQQMLREQRAFEERLREQEALQADTANRIQKLRLANARFAKEVIAAAQREAEDASLLKESLARAARQEAGPVVSGTEPELFQQLQVAASNGEVMTKDSPAKLGPKCGFGLLEIGLDITPKVSRFSKFFESQKEEKTIEQELPGGSTQDSDDSRGQIEKSNDTGEETPTPDTSLDGSQTIPQTVEAPQPVEISDFPAYYYVDEDMYGASPPRVPRPAHSAVAVDTVPVPIPEEAVEFDEDGLLLAQLGTNPGVEQLLDAVNDGNCQVITMIDDMGTYVEEFDPQDEWNPSTNKIAPSPSALTRGINRQRRLEANGIFLPEPSGPEDVLNVLIDREPVPVLNGETDMSHLSNMYRAQEAEQNRILAHWRNNPDDPDPYASLRNFLCMPGLKYEQEQRMVLAGDLVQQLINAEENIWSGGARCALFSAEEESEEGDEEEESDDEESGEEEEKEKDKKKEEFTGPKMLTKLEEVPPAFIHNMWKPETIARLSSHINITHAIAGSGYDGLHDFDEMQATY
ncbi:hypothetical protein DSL72_003067 [Monilinia vaccinii-corymbosi]|uniref:Uncharacterized protein n=1 Tax=Monilinia vaccinii-corymbosi TaxID=61207 RepID=A0A8A3P7G7_9HELO|nr:hypothetical protein DSL72_003067 [Monilinia vaccinii-corymbosi]